MSSVKLEDQLVTKDSQTSESPITKLDEIALRLAEREREPAKALIYTSLKPNQGHAQGDLKIQYLGSGISSELRNGVKPCQWSDTHSIGGTSHILYGDVQLFEPIEAHPLVSNLLFADVGFQVQHDEHAWVSFNQPGWYALRFDRTGAVPAAEIAKPFRTVD